MKRWYGRGLFLSALGPFVPLCVWLWSDYLLSNPANPMNQGTNQGAMAALFLLFLASIVIGAGILGYGLDVLRRNYKGIADLHIHDATPSKGGCRNGMDDCYTPGVSKKLHQFLRNHSLTVAMYSILDQIGNCFHMKESQLLERCVRISRSPPCDAWGEVTIEEVAEAFTTLLAKKYIQRIDASELKRIKEFLLQDPSIPGPPEEDLPRINDIDFTEKGAALFLRLQQEVFDVTDKAILEGEYYESYYRVLSDRRSSVIGTNEDCVTSMFYDNLVFLEFPVTITAASPCEEIGSWRSRWWRIFPSGYRIDVEFELKEKKDLPLPGN